MEVSYTGSCAYSDSITAKKCLRRFHGPFTFVVAKTLQTTIIIMHEDTRYNPINFTDTCDLKWQATRNALILAAFLLSVFSLLFIVLVAAFFRRMLQPALKVLTIIIMKNVSLLSAQFQFSVTKPDMDDLILAEKCSRCKVTFRRPLIWNRKKINCPGCGQVLASK